MSVHKSMNGVHASKCVFMLGFVLSSSIRCVIDVENRVCTLLALRLGLSYSGGDRLLLYTVYISRITYFRS